LNVKCLSYFTDGFRVKLTRIIENIPEGLPTNPRYDGEPELAPFSGFHFIFDSLEVYLHVWIISVLTGKSIFFYDPYYI